MNDRRLTRLSLRGRSWRAGTTDRGGTLRLEGPPAIEGELLIGRTLQAAPAEWESASLVVVRARWLRNGAVIPGATGNTYTLTETDDGAFLEFEEEAANGIETRVARSAPFGPVSPAPVAPSALTVPTISDTTPTEGQVLTITRGTYAGTAPITVATQMQRETGSGSGVYADVSGALGTSYAVTTADIGRRLRVREVATNQVSATGNNFSAVTSAVVTATPQPVIADQSFGPVPENAPLGATVGQVVNTGGVAGTWSINAGPFAIGPTGIITVATALNHAVASSHTQTVTASNEAGSDTASITISVSAVSTDVQRLAGLTITGTGAPDGTIVPFAMAFREGHLAPTQPVLIRRDDTTAALRTQFNILSEWPDGSVKHALMALECPTLASGATLVCSIYKNQTHPDPGSNLVLATALSGRTASIVHTPASGLPHTFNPLAGIGAADWWSGPLYASKRVQLMPIPSANMGGRTSLRLCVDVGIGKDGVLDLDVSTRNDLIMEVGGGIATYARTISIDGVTQHSFAQFNHTQYGWMTRRAARANGGAAPTRPWITHDYAYLCRTGLVPVFDTTLPVSESQYTQNVTNVLAAGNLSLPYDNWGMARDAGQVGGRPEIGRVPYSHALWLTTGRATAQQLAQIHCEVEPLKDYNHHVQATDRPLTCVDAPDFTAGTPNQNTSPAGTSIATARGYPSDQRPTNSVAGGQMTKDEAHQGSYFYVPFLLTGRRMAADSLASRSAFLSVQADDRYRSNQTISWRNDVPDHTTGFAWASNYNMLGPVAAQTRGRANTIRDLARASIILPDAWPNRTFYDNNLAAYVNVLASQLATITTYTGQMAGLIRTASAQGQAAFGGNKEHTAGWMNAYLRWSVQEAAEFGRVGTNADALFDFLIGWVARTMNSSDFNWRTVAAGLDIVIGTYPGTQPTTFFTTRAASQASTLSVNIDVTPNWGTIPGGQQQLGDWMRAVWASMLSALYSPKITEATRYELADAMIRFRNARPGSAVSPAFPRTDPIDGFSTNIVQAMVPLGTSLLFNVAPTVRAGQVFSVASTAPNGTRFGLIRTDGSLPRGPTDDAVGAFVITSQPAGDPFTVSQGGVLVKTGAVTAGPKTVSVYATCFDNAGAETRGSTVNVTVNVT
jgi:hypothetical protein